MERNRKYGQQSQKRLLVEIGKLAQPWRRITLWATYVFMPYELLNHRNMKKSKFSAVFAEFHLMHVSADVPDTVTRRPR